ncbi:nucleoside/nucleotide kinase family protein [Enterobacter sp.]|uniref:nucleoside/nucleotide kinase family protein n=1 Tax=Enterobacter sp. TaxID=42895 RepID=UPI00296FE4A9|nr:nucleoside/nucleotide kinase family protein [Enterobacter sp.]
MKLTLTINGLATQATWDDREIEHLHKPLLRRLANIDSDHRTIIFLSAPPGTGKSTLTAFWEYLCAQDSTLPELQALPMDGFHHYNDWLEAHQLRGRKGAPETFDVDKLVQNLRQIRAGDGDWPQYDRQRHDPVESAIPVSAPLVIVEGNWLLLDDPRWDAVRKYCDFSLFIHAPEAALKARLVARKIAGGLTREQAEDFYQRTDGPNVRKVLTQSLSADVTLQMDADGHLYSA